MERGIVSLYNAELLALQQVAVSQGCLNQELLQKLNPVLGLPKDDVTQLHSVLLSEEDAEVLLDCMPVPTQDDPELLKQARLKIQNFLAAQRFGEQQE